MASVKSVRIEGLEELAKNIERTAASIGPAKAKSIYADGAALIRDRAKQLAPFDPTRRKGTHLRDAIYMYTRNPRESFVLVGVRHSPRGAPHAHLMEFGYATRGGGFFAGRPYFRPAIAEMSDQAGKVIIDGLSKAIEAAAEQR